MTRDEFEELIFEEASQQRSLEQEELVRECMARQGFEYLPIQQTEQVRDPIPGVENEAERIAKIGSGLTAAAIARLERLANGEPTPNANEPPGQEQSDAYYEALSVVVTIDDEDVEGGCIAWAENEYVDRHPEVVIQAEIEEAYAKAMSDALNSVQMSEVNARWADCMTEAGYAGLMELGDHYRLINDRIQEAMDEEAESAQLRELDQVLAFDVAISQSNHACVQMVEEQRQSILSDRFARFVDENRSLVDSWSQATEQGAGRN